MRYGRYRRYLPPEPREKREPEVIQDVEVVAIPPPREVQQKPESNEPRVSPVKPVSGLINRIARKVDLEDLLLLVLILMFLSEENNDDDLIIPILIYIYLG